MSPRTFIALGSAGASMAVALGWHRQLLRYVPAVVAAIGALAGGVAVVKRKRRKPSRRQRVAAKVQAAVIPVKRAARKVVAKVPEPVTKAAAQAAHTARVKAARALLRGGWSLAGPRGVGK